MESAGLRSPALMWQFPPGVSLEILHRISHFCELVEDREHLPSPRKTINESSANISSRFSDPIPPLLLNSRVSLENILEKSLDFLTLVVAHIPGAFIFYRYDIHTESTPLSIDRPPLTNLNLERLSMTHAPVFFIKDGYTAHGLIVKISSVKYFVTNTMPARNFGAFCGSRDAAEALNTLCSWNIQSTDSGSFFEAYPSPRPTVLDPNLVTLNDVNSNNFSTNAWLDITVSTPFLFALEKLESLGFTHLKIEIEGNGYEAPLEEFHEKTSKMFKSLTGTEVDSVFNFIKTYRDGSVALEITATASLKRARFFPFLIEAYMVVAASYKKSLTIDQISKNAGLHIAIMQGKDYPARYLPLKKVRDLLAGTHRLNSALFFLARGWDDKTRPLQFRNPRDSRGCDKYAPIVERGGAIEYRLFDPVFRNPLRVFDFIKVIAGTLEFYDTITPLKWLDDRDIKPVSTDLHLGTDNFLKDYYLDTSSLYPTTTSQKRLAAELLAFSVIASHYDIADFRKLRRQLHIVHSRIPAERKELELYKLVASPQRCITSSESPTYEKLAKHYEDFLATTTPSLLPL